MISSMGQLNRADHRWVGLAVLDAARSKPFLGICMGLQVLMEFSEELAWRLRAAGLRHGRHRQHSEEYRKE